MSPIPPCRGGERLWEAGFRAVLLGANVVAMSVFVPTQFHSATAETWIAEPIQRQAGNGTELPLQHPSRILFDRSGSLLVAWTESFGSGAPGEGWWARRAATGWQNQQIIHTAPSAVFSRYDNGFSALALDTNGTPHLYHLGANFGINPPYFLTRVDLNAAPAGPGQYVVPLGGTGISFAVDADGRASSPPRFVSQVHFGPVRLNHAVDVTPNGVELSRGDLILRQGPEGQVHVLYHNNNGRQLWYSGGSPDRARPILPINTGSSTYDMAVDEANGIHVSAAQGTGLYHFGAVGQLAYLHSADGTTWTTNLFPNLGADVGSTAIALDPAGQPAIAFTRAFSAAYFMRRSAEGWSVPVLLRSGLGGWDRSQAIRLAFSPQGLPCIVVPDHLSRSLLLLTPRPEPVPADLAVVSIASSTNRAALGAAVTWDLIVTNRGPRNAEVAHLRVQLSPEVVVRDLQPRPSTNQGPVYHFQLGTLYAFEGRTLRIVASALDPVQAALAVRLESETAEASPADNARVLAATGFVSPECLGDPTLPGCDDLRLMPANAPPAMALQPWSLPFRVPDAPPGSHLRLAADTPLPPGFCLTLDGELRGTYDAASPREFAFELLEPDGRITRFSRPIPVSASPLPADLIAFWSLDGHARDIVSGDDAALGPRAGFAPSPVGAGLQPAMDALNDPRPDLSWPARLFTSPALLQGEPIGRGPLTLTAWYRQDPGARSRGQPAGGYVAGLAENDQWGRERYLAPDPVTGRMDLADGPPDFRANFLRGPRLTPGVWHHLALVCEGNDVRLFTNGALALQGRFNQPLVERPTVLAGGAFNGAEFAGALDELTLLRGALTAANIDHAIRNPLPRRTPLPAGGDFPLAPTLRELALDAPLAEPFNATLVPAFCGAPRDFVILQGALPSGLVLSREGRITGAAATPGVALSRVQARDAQNQPAEIELRITVKPGLPAFKLQPLDQAAELGALVLLVAETRAPASLQWHRDGHPLPGETRSVLAIPDLSPSQAGSYRVLAANDAGTQWSQEARVSVLTAPPPAQRLAVSPVELQPDGLIRLRLATLPGRHYELQRALDLSRALSGAWQTVQRFVARGGLAELNDRLVARADAAFYRIVEIIPPPAAAYSLEDTTRFRGLAADGEPRQGLLPAVDDTTGNLGAFEYRPGGDAVPEGRGLRFHFAAGTLPLERNGASVLSFTQADLFFPEDSPIQFDENGETRIRLVSSTRLELATGSLTVATLESLLGKAPGSGIRVRLFREHALLLKAGTFEGPLLRGARLAWTDASRLPFPMPSESGDFPQFDLDLTGRRFRIPFHGEFALADGTSSPASLTIPATRPAWLEIGAGSTLSFAGTAELRFAAGPTFNVDLVADPPDFRLALRTRGLRLPGSLPWRSLLLPLPAPPRPPPSAPVSRAARPLLHDDQPPRNYEEYLDQMEKSMAQLTKLTEQADYGSAKDYQPPDRQNIPSEPAAVSEDTPTSVSPSSPDPGKGFRGSDFAESDPVGTLLGNLPLWRAYVEHRGSFANLTTDQQATVRRIVLTRLARIQENFGAQGEPRSPRTFELRARLLEHIVAIAALADDSHDALLSAARNAFELLRQLEGQTDCGAWTTDSLERAVRAIAAIRKTIAQRDTLLPSFAGRDLNDLATALLRCRGERFAADLGVLPGVERPDNNPVILELHRYEAAERLHQATTLIRAGLIAGVEGPVVRQEAVSQLILRLWQDLRLRVVQATRSCDVGTWYYLLPELGEILTTYADLLRAYHGSSAVVDPIVRDAVDLMQLNLAFRDCLTASDVASEALAAEVVAMATDQQLQPRFLLPALRTLRQQLRDVPAELRMPLPALDLHLNATRIRLEAVLSKNLALWVAANGVTVEDVVDLLETGMLHDQILARIQPQAAQLLLTPARLSSFSDLLEQTAIRDRDPENLHRASVMLIEAMRFHTSVQDRQPQDVPPPPSPEVVAWRDAAFAALRETAGSLHTLASAILDHREARSLADLLAAADIQLPGGLTVEQAWGELALDLQRRQLRGTVGGQLRIPGVGLTVNLRNATLQSGGHLEAEISGALQIPAANPLATLTIPAHQPARLRVQPGDITLSGGALLQLPEGGEIQCFLSLDDPIYQFAASARGLRLHLARDLTRSIGLPLPDRLADGDLPSAVTLLTRTGLLLDGAAPAPAPVPGPDDDLAPSTLPGPRPVPSDTDDIVAVARTLELLARNPGALEPPASAAPQLAAPRLADTPTTRASNLVQHLAARLERNSQELVRETTELSQLDLALAVDGASVPPAELIALRGPRLRLVASQLGGFGQDFSLVLALLRQEQLRQMVDATGIPLEPAIQAYLQNFAACLGAIRTNLLAPSANPPARWTFGPHWDPEAARHTLVASQRFLELLQRTGADPAGLAPAAEDLFCDLARAFVDATLADASLDPASGSTPSNPTLRERHLQLTAEHALAAAAQLAELEALAQPAAFCAADPRRQNAIASLALRARNARAGDLSSLDARPFPRPWDRPEALLATATNLLDIVLIPGRLAIDAYPESAPRLRPNQSPPDTLRPDTDLLDLLELLSSAMGDLIRLHDDPRSGYRSELERRARAFRRIPVPDPDQMSGLLAQVADLPRLASFHAQLVTLARYEAVALAEVSSNPGFFDRVQRHARDIARHLLALTRLLDAPASPARASTPLQPRPHAAADQAAQLRLTTEVLPRLAAQLAADPASSWWLSGGVAEELLAAAGQSWLSPAVPAALQSAARANANTLRARVAALRSRLDAPLPLADLALPGEILVQRLAGALTLNRATRFVSVDLGGRLEFPAVPAGPGKVAFFDLERLRLESNGRFQFAASARTPIPVSNAAFTGRVTAQGDWPNRALAFSGRGEIVFQTPPTNPDTGQPFSPTVAASIAYAPAVVLPDGTPAGWRFQVSAGGEFRRSFGPHFALFGAAAGLTAGRDEQGRTFGGVSIGGSAGLIRKASRLHIEPPSLEDFELAVENAAAEIIGIADAGGSVALTNGTLRLPAFFYAADLPPDLRCAPTNTNPHAAGPSIAIREPIRLSYLADGKPRLDGVLRFSSFGVRVPRAPFLSLVMCQADLGLDGAGLPFLDIARAGMQVDLPWDKGVFRLQNLHLGLDGAIRGEILLAEDFDLLNAGGLRITLPAASSLAPNQQPPAGCRGTALVLEDVLGFPTPRVTLTGGLRVELPAEMLTGLDGSRVGGVFCGGIRIQPTDAGPSLHAFIDELALTGEFRFGSSGLALRRARIAAANFDGILAPNSERPFLLSFAGDLEAGPFSFGMTNAQLRYLGPERPPALALEALRFSRDATRPLPPPFAFLPFAVDAAEFRFKNPLAPAVNLLQPSNVVVTASGRVGFPTVERAFVRGGVAGLEFSFNERGDLIPPPIDGFDLGISASAELKLPAFGDLGGKLRIGGLRKALEHGPGHIYAVGEIGGTQQGYRLNFLGALTLAGPVGLCLDVNFGAAGLTLSPTPFQITGASGGFAFLTTDNPCDFRQYFDFNPALGTYQLRQTIELPDIPVGMSWEQFIQTVERLTARVEDFATRFTPPPPVAARVIAPSPASPDARFGCPENCPPRTVAILCQPHPDTLNHSNRIIFKLSSIPESRLTNAAPAGLGLDPTAINRLANNPATLAAAVADRLVTSLQNAAPNPDLPPALNAFLADQERLALEGVRVVASNLVTAAVRNAPNAYAAVRDALYKGIPCPDLSLALAGRMSIVGLSAFGWVEGRQASSFSGSGGVVGELHLLGVPVGQARAFISTTDDMGLPNPSACGQLTAFLGPLDFGEVNLAMRCPGCVTELMGLFPTLVHALGEPFLRGALSAFAADNLDLAADPAALVTRVESLPEAERLRVILGLFTAVMNAGRDELPGNLGELLRAAVTDAWDRIRPQLVLCGDVTPRLFGLPLTLGGRAAALNFLGEKDGVLGEVAFSPAALIPIFPPGDEASLSFAYRMRDPYTILLASLDGSLAEPEARAALVREQTEHLLQNLILAANYQWHPLGLELADAAVRFLVPDLLNHPAFPDRRWRNPDLRQGDGLPSRDELLVQAAASGKLGSAFSWVGSTNDLADIFETSDPRGQTLRAQGLDLRHDYFPHGGIVGGARMALPRLLMAAPGEWTPLYDQAVHGTNLFEQAAAALRLLTEFVLRTDTNGTAAFYVPAPNPPLLYDDRGVRLSPDAIRRRLAEAPDAFTPAGLMDQIRRLDLSAPQSLAHLYPDDLSFLRAEMTNLTLLGVPVFGTATLTGKPTPMRWVDGQPLARLEVQIQAASAIGQLAGRDITLGFDIHATPDRSIAAWAAPLVAGLASRSTAALASHATDPSLHQREHLDRLARELPRQLPRFAAALPLPPVDIADPREWAGPPRTPVLDLDAFSAPKGPPRSPPTPLLRANLTLHAWSPLHEPDAPGDGPLAETRRRGGLAASGRLEILPNNPGRTGAGNAEFAVASAGAQPRLLGRVRNLNLPTPFPGISLIDAQADFDSHGAPFLRARTELPPLRLGELFQLTPLGNATHLAAGVALSHVTIFSGTRILRTTLELPAAQLSSDLLAGRALVVHGPGNITNALTITEGAWSARASFTSPNNTPAALHADPPGADLTLRATLAGLRRDVVQITGLPSGAFAARGLALGQFTATLDATLPGDLEVRLFPGLAIAGLPEPTLRIQPPANGSLQLSFQSDGTFSVSGVLAAPWNAGNPGLFAAGAEVRIDPQGATISGRIGPTTGTLRVGDFNGQIATRFSGQLTLPRLIALGGRLTLASPEGGDLTASNTASGVCVSGAVLTLRDFAPNTSPVTLSFPAFCLDAASGFRDLPPTAPGNPSLPAGGFVLESLRNLRLRGNFSDRSLSLDFDADLRRPPWLSLPARGTLGSEGLRLQQASSTASFLGFAFDSVRAGVTNVAGDIPGLAFSARIPALPAPLGTLSFGGEIPASGGFRLTPANPSNLPSLIEPFPLQDVVPALEYRAEPYPDVLRADQPAGYWPLEETGTTILDQRRTTFDAANPRRNGRREGSVLTGQPGALDDPARRAIAFDGASAVVRITSDALAPGSGGFSVSLWFKRTGGRTGPGLLTTPQTLAARGTQWRLFLQGTAATGTRLHWHLQGLRNDDGLPLPPITSRTSVDDDRWHHLVVVHDSAAQYLYLDGRLDQWQPALANPDTLARAETSLGALSDGGSLSQHYAGLLDEVAVYDRALAPADVLGQWLAAGARGGVSLAGSLRAGTIPGMAVATVDGFLAPDGSAALSLGTGEGPAFSGLNLPLFSAQLVRSGNLAGMPFRSLLALPSLEPQPFAAVQGVFSGDGQFRLRSWVLPDRPLLGWDLRLTNFVASGNWLQRQAATTLGAWLQLPHNLARLEVGGSLDTAEGEFHLRGRAGGGFSVGTRSFAYEAAPELSRQRFRVPGEIRLGTQSDAARLNTVLEIQRTGELRAEVGGETPWTAFPPGIHGALRWSGLLAFENAYPQMRFTGTLALASPGHPESIDELPEGFHDRYRRECWTTRFGFEFCSDVLDGLTLRTNMPTLHPNARGELTLQVQPAFLNQALFQFRLP